MRRADVLNALDIRPGDFVVDVGGGHRPFPRADLIVEKFPFDDHEHRVGSISFCDVPVIKADAAALPIPDGACDLLFASHIIEHLPDPRAFIGEVQRCARRVYLEFPSRSRELMYAWSFHAWLVETDGATLKFYRNDLPQLFGALFHAGYDAALGAWSDARHEVLNTSLCCEARALRCEFPSETATELLLRTSSKGEAKINLAMSITRPRYSWRDLAALAAQSLLPAAMYDRLARGGRTRTARPAAIPETIVARLMCLHCRGATLRSSGETITCACGARYSQDRGVFDFDAPRR